MPNSAKYPNAYRWFKHIASYEPEFSSLPGDPSKAYTTYGPEKSEAAINPKDAPAAIDAEDEDDVDLFGSDDEEEDAEAIRIKEENLAAYKKKKEGKTKPAAKSIVTLDVKPWGMWTINPPLKMVLASCVVSSKQLTWPHKDDETDMKELEVKMRAIEIDGLTWGASKLVPLAFGIKKLQVNLVVEDEKVSIDDLQAQIEADEDHVQSTDVVSRTIPLHSFPY